MIKENYKVIACSTGAVIVSLVMFLLKGMFWGVMSFILFWLGVLLVWAWKKSYKVGSSKPA